MPSPPIIMPTSSPKEDIEAVEDHLVATEERNYAELLPVLVPLDPKRLEEKKEAIERCIKRASHSIYKHPHNRWVYHAYLILGKARLFNQEHEDATVTFRYINAKSKNPMLRHYAMIYMARAFLSLGDVPNALKIMEYLDKEPTLKKRAKKRTNCFYTPI